ncbi:MAG: ABC transporter ATP-binding protein [Alphaproteobacteria bacterium]
MSAALLTVTDLGVAYAGAPALAGVALEVPAASAVAVLGPNGAGKSSLLRAVMGLAPAREGKVSFDGVELRGRPAEARARLGIGYVPEGRRVFPGMTVRENLEVAARGGARERGPVLDGVLALFPQLAERASDAAWRLSGGQQQMLSIGRALMSRPRLVLMDEPSLGLSPAVARDVFAALSRITRTGTAILLAEQNVHWALRLAGRGVVLRRGRIVARGDAARVRAALDLPAPSR